LLVHDPGQPFGFNPFPGAIVRPELTVSKKRGTDPVRPGGLSPYGCRALYSTFWSLSERSLTTFTRLRNNRAKQVSTTPRKESFQLPSVCWASRMTFEPQAYQSLSPIIFRL